MVTDINNYFRVFAYLLISVSCFFSIRHHGCSKWILYGSLFWSLVSGALLLTNMGMGRPYVVQFLHTANIFTLAIFYWIHFLSLTPNNGHCKTHRRKTGQGV